MIRKLNTITWIYIMFLCCFSEFLGLFIPKLLLRILYIVAVFVIILFNKKILIRKIDCCVIAYILLMCVRFLVQVLFGPISVATNISFFQTTIPVFAYFTAILLEDEQAKKIEYWFALFCTVSVIAGILNEIIHFLPSTGAFSGGLYAYAGNSIVQRGYSLAGNALNTGFMCAIAVALLLHELSIKKSIKTVIMLSVSIAGLFLSYSRGAIACLFIAILVYGWNKFKKSKSKIPKKILFNAVITIVIGFLIFAINFSKIKNSAIILRIFNAGLSLSESSNASRVIFIRNAIRYFSDYFMFGKGFGYTGYQAMVQGVPGRVNTESYILSIGLNVGVIGIVLFLVIMTKSIFNSEHNTQYASIVCGIFAWSVVYILLDSDVTALVCWYLIGRIWSKNRIDTIEKICVARGQQLC